MLREIQAPPYQRNDITEHATRWLADFAETLACRETTATLALFAGDCFWGDMVAFTWNIKTMEGKEEVRKLLEATLRHVQIKAREVGISTPVYGLQEVHHVA
jgi:hypothetical protein